jgi:hypothetical protein
MQKRTALHLKVRAKRTATVVEYLTTNGPTPRRTALRAMAAYFFEHHSPSKSSTLDYSSMRLAEHMREMERDGALIRGPRPHQILSLPE